MLKFSHPVPGPKQPPAPVISAAPSAPTPAQHNTHQQTHADPKPTGSITDILTLVIGDREQVTRVLLRHGWTQLKTKGSYLFESPKHRQPKDFPMARHLQLRELVEPYRGKLNV